jgi:VCBS repeat-containing protein
MQNLTVGQSYTYGVQWQQILFTDDNTYAYSGGSLTIQRSDALYDYTAQIYNSGGYNDGWNTALYTFFATAQTMKITLGVSGSVPYPNVPQAPDIIIDSLTASQIAAAMPVASSPGVAVGTVFGTVNDVDANATLKGWAITSAAAATDGTGKHWQYSTNGGTTWTNMDGASLTSAIYLSSSDLVRWSGTEAAGYTRLEAKAVDNTGPALHAANAAATLIDVSISGGNTAFSANTAAVGGISILGFVDDVGPDTGTLLSGSSTNDNAPLLQGSLDATLASGNHVEVYRDGVDLGAATVSGSSWSFQDSNVGDGTHSYTALIKTSANATVAVTGNSLTLSVDTAAPTQKPSIVSYTDNVGPVTGNLASGTATNDTTPLLNGTLLSNLASGEVVNVYRDGALLGTAVVNGTQWTYQDKAVANGSHSYTVQVADLARNVGPMSDALVLTEDTALPTIALGRSVDHLANGQNTTVTFTLSEASSDFNAGDITVSGGSLSNFSGSGTSYSATLTASSDNARVSVASSVFSDAAGNLNADGAEANNALDFGTNAAPVKSAAISANTSEGMGLFQVDLLGNISDANGDALSVSGVTYSVNGGTGSATLPSGVSLAGTGLVVDRANAGFDTLAVGEQTSIVASYTVSDGRGGSVQQTATVVVAGTNDAPVITNTTANASASGLFGGVTANGSIAIGGPAIDGPNGVTPAGWHATYITPSNSYFFEWNKAGATMGGYFSDTLNGQVNQGGTGYVISGLTGTSLSGGLYLGLTDYHSSYTWLDHLTVGQTYTYGVQWQQVRNDLIDDNLVEGGFLTIQASNATTISAKQTYSTTSDLYNDSWTTALYTFVATSETMQINLGAANAGGSYALPAIVVDSLTTAQVAAAAGAGTGNGATTNSVFGSVSDADHSASLQGWAITSAAADSAGHHWQYSTNAGTTWSNMDAASASQAIYLSTTDLVRWTGAKGANTELDAKAVDDTGPALHAANAAATLVDTSVSGGSSAFCGNKSVLAANAPPIVFDLNHDGHIDYSNITMAMDGHQVNTAWVGANDGMLLWDKYGDATVHGSEQYVFGQATGSDLSGLRLAFDSNNDGLFNAKDAQFAQFGIWQDANQNGVAETGEYHTLAQLGIASLSLTSDGVSSTPMSGVTVNGQTTATLIDGSTMRVEDAIFSYSHSATAPQANFAQLLIDQAINRSAVM